MQTLLILVELFVSVGLIVVILLQRSEGGALGMGGGGSGLGGLFSPRGAADTLTRTTGILGGGVLPDLPGAQSGGAARPRRALDPRHGAEHDRQPAGQARAPGGSGRA